MTRATASSTASRWLSSRTARVTSSSPRRRARVWRSWSGTRGVRLGRSGRRRILYRFGAMHGRVRHTLLTILLAGIPVSAGCGGAPPPEPPPPPPGGGAAGPPPLPRAGLAAPPARGLPPPHGGG